MPTESDDPRLTAYALGEMDAEDRAAFERELGDSPAARREVEEIQRLAGLVGAALAEETGPELDAPRRAAILTPETQPAHAAHWRGMTTPRWLGAVVAAGFSGVILTAVTMKSLESKNYVVASGESSPYYTQDDVGYTPRRDLSALSEKVTPLSTAADEDHLATAAEGMRYEEGQTTHYDGAKPSYGTKVTGASAATAPVSTDSAPEPARPAVSLSKNEATGGAMTVVPAENQSPSVSNDWSDLTRRRANLSAGGRPASSQAGDQSGGVEAARQGGGQAVGDRWESRTKELYSATTRGFGRSSAPAGATRRTSTGEAILSDELQDSDSDFDLVGRPRGALSVEVYDPFSTEAYDAIVENPFKQVTQEPLSTFSIDVDTASYANVRRFLTQQTLPPPGAVRLEEMINYFSYDYAPPSGDEPFATHVEVAQCPWDAAHRLVRIGIKGREIAADKRPASNLVFLIDVSGSMQDANKLELVKTGLRLLTAQLTENDRVAMVVYAGSSGQVLASTPGNQKETILAALDQLSAGGSTNGAGGIEQAYQVAVESFIKGGTNRVILCTDGDFNVGVTDQSQLVELIEGKAKSGVFLSVLGFGMGNLKDSTLEKLSDKGNGNYAYIDTEREARKVLVEQMSGTLVTIAKDVKIQIEFNPAKAASYRLIGYENRLLAKEDFNDDTKDAGEIGAGHTVTALYEVVPVGEPIAVASVDDLEYQTTPGPNDMAKASGDLLMLKLRYKKPDGDVSQLIKTAVADTDAKIGQASADFQFASSVATFGMLLRHSKHAEKMTYAAVLELAQPGLSRDAEGYRAEFVELVKTAQSLSGAK